MNAHSAGAAEKQFLILYLIFVPEASLPSEGSFLLVVQSASASIFLRAAKVRGIPIGDARDWLKNNKYNLIRAAAWSVGSQL